MVTNTGLRTGAAVPQLYLVSASGAPLLRLVGFSRVLLQPGERREVTLDVEPRLLAHWDERRRCWQISAGRYVFALGRSSSDLGEPATAMLRAGRLKP
jgi:beta-glucosidase